MRRAWLLALLLAAATGSESRTWRSRLFPADWVPGFAVDGLALQDFSWAGYRHGAEPPRVTAPVVDATDHGVTGDGVTDDTAALQAVLDTARGVVHLPAGLYRLDGTLTIERPGVVLRGAGPDRTRLRFTKAGGLDGRAHLTLRGRLRRGEPVALSADARCGDTDVRVVRLDGLSVGDEFALGFVVTDEFRAEHGMEAYWKFAAGQWRALFRRTITGLDRTTRRVAFAVPLRHGLRVRDEAALRVETGYLRECGVESLAVCNAVSEDDAWAGTRVHAVELRDAADCWVRDVASFAAQAGGDHLQSGGIRVRGSKRVTVAGCAMALAQNRGGGGNGYLFEIMQSNEVLTRDCTARRGRHNFIQNWDFGTSGCVWLRCVSREGHALFTRRPALGVVGTSEYHHSLSMGCLVDSCVVDDGWRAVNRLGESSGAGHTATECVFWNVRGTGFVQSAQWGLGYVIGTAPGLRVVTALDLRGASGTGPEDHVEGLGAGPTLEPASLYEAQRARRLAAD